MGEIADFNPKSVLPETFEYVDLESVVGTDIISHRLEHKDSAPSRAQRLAQKDDVFYQTVRPYQKNNCIFDKPDNDWVFSTGYAQLRPKKDSYFLLVLLQNNSFMRKVLDRCTGTSYPAINSKDLAQIKISISDNIDEQKKIGSLFRNVDRTITLHQRKLDLLKQLKKGFLQQTFPQNGETTPKLRFTPFTDAWEQCKFSELYKKNLERNKDQFSSDRTISIATMRFKEEGNGAAENSLVSYKVLREGDIAFEGHTSKQFAFGRFVLNDIGDGIMSPRFTTLRPTQDMPIKFWKQYIHCEPIMRYPIVNSTKLGTMMNELVVDEFLNQPVLVPELSEQQKIGSFFNQLDGTITLHQRKLILLKQYKQGFLQKMFI